jgi:hypothetical protein
MKLETKISETTEISNEAVKEFKKKVKKYGSKEEVYNGLATQTRGGLLKNDLCLNIKGGVCSKKQVQIGKNLFSLRMKTKSKPQQEEK